MSHAPSPSAHRLDASTFPLNNTRLIEASAGTGKTWTIAALYLRLVLGHGNAHTAFGADDALRTQAATAQLAGRALVPGQILVMTFTRAATRELIERIRARLVQALMAFRAADVEHTDDPLLAALIADHPTAALRQRAAWLLEQAAQAMDEAAIYTIDAWCQRVLREHALQSALAHEENLDDDPKGALQNALLDYWRSHVYPLNDEAFALWSALWPSAEQLLHDVQAIYEKPLDASLTHTALHERITQLRWQHQQQLQTLAAGWSEKVQQLHAWLSLQTSQHKAHWNGQRLRSDHWQAWLQTLAHWAEHPHTNLGAALRTGAQRLTPEGLEQARKANAPALAHHELPAAVQELPVLLEALAQLPGVRSGLLAHAGACVAQRLHALRQAAHTFSFADLLHRLDAALDSEAGPALRQRLREQYPVALIDEFQDTSALQYRLFERIYGADADCGDATSEPQQCAPCALLLIGDPKQSIYRFRGADIDSYLRARAATAGRHYVLDTNRRSATDVVHVINALFENAENRAPDSADAHAGAFLYASAQDNALPFIPVQAHGRAEVFVGPTQTGDAHCGHITLATQSALHIHWCEAQSPDGKTGELTLNASILEAYQAAACAAHIVGWLNSPHVGFMPRTSAQTPDTSLGCFEAGCAPEGFVRLMPKDIAILVRTSHEAALMREHLQRLGLQSVYLSERQSVFTSDEAHDMLAWLQAVAEPLNTQHARSALANHLMALSLEELRALSHDDEQLDAYSVQLMALHHVWQRQGVLAMLHQSLHRLQWPQRWQHRALSDASAPSSERVLTNYLHLAELLQNASSAHASTPAALIRWLRERINNPSDQAQDQLLRLQSDADLIQIVTIHKSKGLEYPIVCLPFAANFRAADRSNTPFVPSHWRAQAPRSAAGIELHVSSAALQWAEQQRLREDVRLLYVALTRARHVLWLGAGPLRQGQSAVCVAHRSALGWLLGGAQERTSVEFREQLQHFANACNTTATPEQCPRVRMSVHSVDPQRSPRSTSAAFVPRQAPRELMPAPLFTGSFERDWSIGSFSALVRGMHEVSSSADPGQVIEPFLPSLTREVLDTGSLPRYSLGEDEPDHRLSIVAAPTAEAAPTSSVAPWHSISRGSLLGNFVHEQLQWLCAERLRHPSQRFALPAVVQQRLLRHCEHSPYSAQAPALAQWLEHIATAPLVSAAYADVQGTRPSLWSVDSAQAELEFWLSTSADAQTAIVANASHIDALCQQHLWHGQVRPALAQRSLRGMLMGFADLVFEHNGRWWVLDYKTNYLGSEAGSYHERAQTQAMLANRYDVQAAIYLLALHRLLRSRLGASYCPEKHLGGAVYFFVRGIDGPSQGLLHLPPDAHTLALITELDALLKNAHIPQF